MLILGVAGLLRQYSSSPPMTTTQTESKPPEPQQSHLIDEQFKLEANTYNPIKFSIPDTVGSARIAGGFKVLGKGYVDVFVYPEEAYRDYPTNGLKPVHLEQSRNNRINARLQQGTYYLVFENNTESPVELATELFLIYD